MKFSLFIYLPILTLASGCATKLTPQEVGNIPTSTGFYGGSILFDKWVYLGSTTNTQHFRYTWNTNNILHSKRVSISPKVNMSIEVDYPSKLNNPKNIYAVTPIYHNEILTGFKHTPNKTNRINGLAIDKFIKNPYNVTNQ